MQTSRVQIVHVREIACGLQSVPLRYCSGSRDVSYWKPLLVRAVIAIQTSSVSQLPCLATDRGSACSNFPCFCSCSGTQMLKLSRHGRHDPCLVVRTCIAGSGGYALHCCGDRRCANRQRDFVVYEGKLMSTLFHNGSPWGMFGVSVLPRSLSSNLPP
jgi:hypothetical protein